MYYHIVYYGGSSMYTHAVCIFMQVGCSLVPRPLSAFNVARSKVRGPGTRNHVPGPLALQRATLKSESGLGTRLGRLINIV